MANREGTIKLADSLRLNVKEACEAKGKSLQALCMEAGTTPASVYLMLAKGNPRLSSLEQLADILSTPVSILLQFRENAPDYTGMASLRGPGKAQAGAVSAPALTAKEAMAKAVKTRQQEAAPATPALPRNEGTPPLTRKLKFSVKQG